jgi:hypothetical protein
MGPICCPETSVRNYQYLLRNNPEELDSHLLIEDAWNNVFSIPPKDRRDARFGDVEWYLWIGFVGENDKA